MESRIELVVGVTWFTEWGGGRVCVWHVQPVSAHTLTPAHSRLRRSRAWRWNLKHLCPTLGQPAPFKVSYTSESSLFIIARLNQRWMWERAAKSPHWIRAHQRHRLIILWLIVRFFMFALPLTACDCISSFTETTGDGALSTAATSPMCLPKNNAAFLKCIFDWKTMKQIKRNQMTGRHSLPLCSQGTEDANKRGFNQLERNVSGRVLHSQSPHVSALLHICSPI